MPTFDFVPLLWWGLPLAAAPVLIHLISRLRHRRVRWAAMEFLLASQRKYRTRAVLRELLLLALRSAAVAGIVLALAQPRWTDAFGGLWAGRDTTHVVLLDDSLSMGDRSGATESAFDRGRRAVAKLATALASARGSQRLTVGLFSTFRDAGERPPLLVDRSRATAALAQRLERDLAEAAAVSATGPRQPLVAALDMLAERGGDRVVWIVSDLRSRDWLGADEVTALLDSLAAGGTEVRLVDCAVEAGAGEGNLTIEGLHVVGSVPARNVVLPVEITVRNDGPRPARDVAVALREDGAARPGISFESIASHEAVTRRFDVRFDAAGDHLVEAVLPDDVLPADNARRLVVDVAPHVEMLVIDGGARQGTESGDAFYVTTALAPGRGAPTGLRPRVESASALTTLDLQAFDGIWLLDVERLDPAAVAALEAYVRAGGGVVFFCGPRTRAEVVNDAWHRDGDGLFPVPLVGPVDVAAGAASADSALVVEDHPVVAVLAGQRNPFVAAVRIDRLMAIDRGATPPAGLRRLLSLGSGAAVAVERPYGAGLVVAVLTTAAPTWNTWARGNPSWVVTLLELAGRLVQCRRSTADRLVDAPLVVALRPGIDELDVEFLVPPDGSVVRRAAEPLADGSAAARLDATAEPGVYSARWRTVDGGDRERSFAVNVDAAEGRLERAGRVRLGRTLDGVPFVLEPATAFDTAAGTAAGSPLSGILLITAVAILVVEQVVAFTAGYHPVNRRVAAT